MKKPQLFLLHFAGGNIYSFRQLSPFLDGFEVIPIELPGRGKRTNEGLLYDHAAAVADLYEQIKARRNDQCRFLIFGHSLGAYLALPLAHMLEEQSDPPAAIFVSGHTGPGSDNDEDWHTLSDLDFIDRLIALEGMPPEVFTDSELMDYYLPILKADFQISEKSPDKNYVIHIPIYAMMGDQEEDVSCIQNWKKFTTASFQFRVFEGGHFFIHEHPQKIAETIKEWTISVINS